MFKRIFKYHYSKLFAYFADIFSLVLALQLLFFLNGANQVIRNGFDSFAFVLFSVLGITLAGGYKMLLRFTTFIDIGRVAFGLFIASISYAFYIQADSRGIYLYLIILFYFSLSFLSFYRLVIRLLFVLTGRKKQLTKTLLFGAGENGVVARRALASSNVVHILGFIDDDIRKKGRTIEGLMVYSLDKKIKKLIHREKITQIIITTNSISRNRKSEIFNFFKNEEIEIFTVPSIDQWTKSGGLVNNITPFKIEDILSREEIKIDLKRNQEEYHNKVILVTGAAGSIGSEIVRQILPFSPRKIILFDQSETPLFNLKSELLKENYNIEFVFLLQDIKNNLQVEQCFQKNKIDIVFHAAAYKHVFMTEDAPHSVILNNVLGTKIVLDTALKNNVSRFVLISTDKAVNPSNIMGATKRITEIYATLCSKNDTTKIITTRFGNVLGSNGSVIPVFEKQIKKGGPITVTHPEITRFFMTIPEACQLVLEAGAMGVSNDIFVFDMGDPVKIIDLAVSMIRLSGLVENQDIKIKITGLRPGEKLYEEILTSNENLKPSHNKLIYIAEKEQFEKEKQVLINSLIRSSLDGDENEKVVAQMKEIVPEFKSMNSEYESLDN